jgi:putative endonuclease
LRRSYRLVSEAWVYLLRCTDGSIYTGWTVDLERRLARHRAGTASRYTASRLPVELAHAIPMPDRTAARREEARIKRLSRAEKLALVGISGPSIFAIYGAANHLDQVMRSRLTDRNAAR